MNFTDAFAYLYRNRISDEEFSDPFLLYCRLSDLCSSSYEDKRKVLLFYQVNKQLDLVRSILDKDESVAAKHEEVADLLSENSFQKMLESVKSVVYSEYRRKGQPESQRQKKAVAQAVITKTEEPEETETRTPLASAYSGYGNKEAIIISTVIVGIVLAIGLFITLACVFAWPWTVWQWFIGIVGGLVLSAVLAGLVAWFDEECIVDYYVLGTFVLGACVLLNFILLLIFKGNYKTIFSWFSGFELIVGAILAFVTFDDIEDGWGATQIVETGITIILFVIVMIWI